MHNTLKIERGDQNEKSNRYPSGMSALVHTGSMQQISQPEQPIPKRRQPVSGWSRQSAPVPERCSHWLTMDERERFRKLG